MSSNIPATGPVIQNVHIQTKNEQSCKAVLDHLVKIRQYSASMEPGTLQYIISHTPQTHDIRIFEHYDSKESMASHMELPLVKELLASAADHVRAAPSLEHSVPV